MVEKINLANYILENISKYNGNKIAIKDDETSITYEQIPQKVKAFAYYLDSVGLKSGDRVAIVMGDCIDWCIAFLAITYIGASTVLISPKIPKQNITNMLRNSNTRGIIYDNKETDLSDMDIDKHVSCIDRIEIQISRSQLENFYQFHPDEISLWCTSSGTCGRGQRFVLHKHQCLLSAIPINIYEHDIKSSSVIFSTPKLSYQYGLANMIYGISAGAEVILSKKIPGSQHIFATVKDNSVTHLYTNATIITLLTKQKPLENYLMSVQYIVCGGDPLPKFIENRFMQIYDKHVFNGIGMAEVLTWATTQNYTTKKLGSIGKPVVGIQCQVRDSLGNLCKAYEVGELYISHPCAAVMYWNSIESTRETFCGNWVRTKDMVWYDNDGFYYYFCRFDDLIKINGSFVSPIEIEEELAQHESVDECIVGSYIDEYGMAKIESKIILKENAYVTAGDIRRFLKQKLGSDKIPKRILFVDTIAKTVTLKKIRKNIHLSV